MQKVLVIGSNSFSGSHFVDFLLESTDYDVIGISRSKEKIDIYLPYKKHDSKTLKRFRFLKLDLNKDINKIIEIIDELKPEYIVNFASQSMVGQSWSHPEHWYNTNVISTVKLIDRIKDKKFLKKYVHISTPEVYGNCKGTVKEDALFNPSTPYAASRAAADVFIQLMIKTYNFPAVFTRAANVYGKGQQLFKIIPRAILFIKKNKKIPLHGGGYAKRSFIHIRDVCSATQMIMEKGKNGDVYHISTDILHSIRGLVQIISKKMNVDFDNAIIDAETRLGLDDAYILDSSKVKKEFGWKPKISIDEGIDEVVSWINNNYKIISKEPDEYIHKE